MTDDIPTEEHDPDDEKAELIDAMKGDLSDVYGQISEMAFEIDDYLAEYQYEAVMQTIDSLAALIDGDDMDDAIELAHLCGTVGRETLIAGEASAPVRIPRLTAVDLSRIAEPESNDDYHDIHESLRERQNLCADHIRRLFQSAAESWDRITVAAERGQIDQVSEALVRIRELPTELTAAYSLWELCLVDLYNENPGNLGHTGELLLAGERWLTSQRNV